MVWKSWLTSDGVAYYLSELSNGQAATYMTPLPEKVHDVEMCFSGSMRVARIVSMEITRYGSRKVGPVKNSNPRWQRHLHSKQTLPIQRNIQVKKPRLNGCCIKHPPQDSWLGTPGQHQVWPIMTRIRDKSP